MNFMQLWIHCQLSQSLYLRDNSYICRGLLELGVEVMKKEEEEIEDAESEKSFSQFLVLKHQN